VVRACDRWLGTPWRAGQRVRGVGVDCVQFVAAVWDDLAGTRTEVPRAPQDSGSHAGGAVNAAGTLAALHRVHGVDQLTPAGDGTLEVEAGDLLVLAFVPGGGPGHAAIVGARPHIYHAAARDRVRRISPPPGAPVLHAYRPRNRDTWEQRFAEGAA
jgi:cell wall-associated NlpC family hydrolase